MSRLRAAGCRVSDDESAADGARTLKRLSEPGAVGDRTVARPRGEGGAAASDPTGGTGATLWHCERLCEVANGGQAVVTSPTASLVGEALLAGSSVHDPWIHHLRELSPSERVFELRDCQRSRQEPQQLRSLDTHPNNLPT